MRTSKLILFLLTAALMAYAAPTRLVGVVLEAGTDRPVDAVAISYKSGKKISVTDSRGRFEVEVTSQIGRASCRERV